MLLTLSIFHIFGVTNQQKIVQITQHESWLVWLSFVQFHLWLQIKINMSNNTMIHFLPYLLLLIHFIVSQIHTYCKLYVYWYFRGSMIVLSKNSLFGILSTFTYKTFLIIIDPHLDCSVRSQLTCTYSGIGTKSVLPYTECSQTWYLKFTSRF